MNARRVLPMVAVLAISASCVKRGLETQPVAPAESPQQALDRMDTRIPLPLLAGMANMQKQNMRDHLVAVQDIVLALSTDDFAGVESAAGRIGTAAFDGETCQRMGLGAEGFAEQSNRFHRTADGIAEAARKRDRAAVLARLGETLQTCTGCHAAYKQVVVDDAAFSRAAASAGR